MKLHHFLHSNVSASPSQQGGLSAPVSFSSLSLACPSGRTSPAGISLIEILVVIVIIGVLAAVVVPNVMSRPDEARVVAAKQDFATLSQSLELYRLDNFQYPTDAQGLQALVERPTVAPIPPNWRPGGYIKKAPQDPWGQPYSYQRAPDGLSFEIRSLGADAAAGGEGVSADLSSKGL